MVNEHRYPEWLRMDCLEKLDKVKFELEELKEVLMSIDNIDSEEILFNVVYKLSDIIDKIGGGGSVI